MSFELNQISGTRLGELALLNRVAGDFILARAHIDQGEIEGSSSTGNVGQVRRSLVDHLCGTATEALAVVQSYQSESNGAVPVRMGAVSNAISCRSVCDKSEILFEFELVS